MRVNKAVFPVAGLGSRTLPATKVLAKEMLPLVDRPLIQYAVEEACGAGIRELIFVTSQAKDLIRRHFQPNEALEKELALRGKQELLDAVRGIPPAGANCHYVIQPEPLGLGHAVLCAANLVGNEPFAVILPDDLIYHDTQSCLQQMLELCRRKNAGVIAVENVAPEDVSRYGIVEASDTSGGIKKMRAVVEKPAPDDAPSTLAVVGRYIFTPTILPLLETVPRGAGNEIQLTDAIAALIEKEDVYLCEFAGRRSDCGSLLGYMKAGVEYALMHDTIGAGFHAYLNELLEELAPRDGLEPPT